MKSRRLNSNLFFVPTNRTMMNLPRWNLPYYPPAPKIVKDSLKKNNLTRDGHLFMKTYDEQDETLLLEPHRGYTGIFLYKKYKSYDKKESLLVECSCAHYGNLCKYCVVLNTSSFHDLEIPLNPEDFHTWKQFFLKQQKWKEVNLYNWLSFWLDQWNRRWIDRYYHERLVFFSYDKFFHMSQHKFFYYLFQFTTSGKVFQKDPPGRQLLPVDMNGGAIRKSNKNQKVKPNHVAVITGDAMFRFTYQLYKKGGRVKSVGTGFKRKSIIEFTDNHDGFAFHLQRQKSIREEKARWKRVFQYTIDEINHEVRFRPGMCGMEECRTSFLQAIQNF